MKALRFGTFETNSSSTHSLTIVRPRHYGPLKVEPDSNRVEMHCGEFGWEREVYSSPEEKLCYLWTMFCMTELHKADSLAEIKFLPGFQLINDAVAENCNCDGISARSITHSKYGGLDCGGYIDHQSCEDYSSVQDFLDQNGMTVASFIFDDTIAIQTGNDNG